MNSKKKEPMFDVQSIQSVLFIFNEFIIDYILLKIYRGRRGGLTVGICQADVMKKSNHFIVTANYYGFIIL